MTQEVIETDSVKPADISLVIESANIDHPSFPVRWKLSNEILERIKKGLAQGYGYAVLVQARLKDDLNEHYVVRGVNEPLQYFRLMEIPCPGTWHFDVFLFERTQVATSGERTTEVLCRDLTQIHLKTKKGWKKHRDNRKYDFYCRNTANTEIHNISGPPSTKIFSLYYDQPKVGAAIALDTMTIDVPSTVFAPEPPKWLADYGNYFFRGRAPYDPCDFGWRLIGMIPGFFPWLFLELLKRALLGIGATLFFLFCFRDWWKVGDRALEPAVNVRLVVEDFDSDELVAPFDGHPGILFTPGILIIYAAVLKLLFMIYSAAYLPVTMFFTKNSLAMSSENSKLLGVAVIMLLCGSIILAALDTLVTEIRRQREKGEAARRQRRVLQRELAEKAGLSQTLELGAHEASLVEKYNDTLTQAPEVKVALDAVPVELRPSGFNWLSLFKRDRCAPFGKA